jgi:hypothetical protein
MEGFSFVTPVTGFNRPYTGKEDDDDDDEHKVTQHNSTITPNHNLFLHTHF